MEAKRSASEKALGRAQSAFGLVWASEFALIVALSVIAFGDGGATAVGLVLTLRMLPAALLGPVGAALSDRMPRERLFAAAAAIRGLFVALMAAAVAVHADALAVYALALPATMAFAQLRPAHSALVPLLCRTPQQLAQASAVRGLMDSAGVLIGPVAATAGQALGGPQLVLAVVAAASALSAVLILRVHYTAPARESATRPRFARELAAGARLLRRHGDVATVVGVALTKVFTRGCLSVLTVVIAIDLLHAGDTGVGLLSAAIGAGAVAGSLGARAIARGRALARWEGAGAAMWGIGLLGCALLPAAPVVIACLVAAGVGNALVDVGMFTVPSRLISEALLGRVFGAFESLAGLTLALGCLTASVLMGALGLRGTLLAVGLVAPISVLALWARLRQIDAALTLRDSEIAVLRAVPMLDVLTLPAIEELAERAQAAVVAAGTPVVVQGDSSADRYYVIASGEAEVAVDGHRVALIGPGDGFGEVALIHDSRRTATVSARSELRLRSLGREDFLRLAAPAFAVLAPGGPAGS